VVWIRTLFQVEIEPLACNSTGSLSKVPRIDKTCFPNGSFHQFRSRSRPRLVCHRSIAFIG